MVSLVQDNVKIPLKSFRLMNHNSEDLSDVSIELSTSLSLLSFLGNDFASRDATNGTSIDSSPFRSTELADIRRLGKMSPRR